MRVLRATNGWIVLPNDPSVDGSRVFSHAVLLLEHPVTKGLDEDGQELLLSMLNSMEKRGEAIERHAAGLERDRAWIDAEERYHQHMHQWGVRSSAQPVHSTADKG
jgi:hypothetical protein